MDHHLRPHRVHDRGPLHVALLRQRLGRQDGLSVPQELRRVGDVQRAQQQEGGQEVEVQVLQDQQGARHMHLHLVHQPVRRTHGLLKVSTVKGSLYQKQIPSGEQLKQFF